MNTLFDLIRSPWAIVPSRLDEIEAAYAAQSRGTGADISRLVDHLGQPPEPEQPAYALKRGGVAVMSIDGVLVAKSTAFTKMFGGISAQLLQRQVRTLRAHSGVKAAILAIDSPGGSAFGIPALAGEVRKLAAEKPTVAVSTGMMTAAGYWLGSAANAVFASGATDIVGSIGVVMRHTYDPRAGETATEIVAGRYKRIASDLRPLSNEGAAYLQQQVDEIYAVFVEAVAAHRRVPVDAVLEHMADGRVFVGSQALDAGLIDGFASVDDLVDQLATAPSKFAQRRRAVVRTAQRRPAPRTPR